jgi:hypothetical protein
MTTRPKPPRAYSGEFPVARHEKRLRVEIDRIPKPLYHTVRKEARDARVSLRTLTLRLWSQWIADRQRDRVA